MELLVVQGEATAHPKDDILEWTQIPTQNGDVFYLNRIAYTDIYNEWPPIVSTMCF